ncbi:MAG: hypothetical protein MRZ52_09290 [Oscillospiraceae bacterium]|nr:hypothetical protein [Oscillospiraceae bacterium]
MRNKLNTPEEFEEIERDWELWVHERTRELFDDWDEVMSAAADVSGVLNSVFDDWSTGTAEEPRETHSNHRKKS